MTRLDVGLAMLVAGAVNLSMLLVAATNLQGRDNTDSIEGAHAAVRDTLGPTVALFFAIGLLASGLASTSVGAYAGAMIMQGLLRRSYPLLLRRLVTLIPALAILAIGVDPSRALVLSQVVLSFGIPFALIPLVRLTSNRSLMGEDTNHRVTTALGWTVAALISVLNVVLIYLTATGCSRWGTEPESTFSDLWIRKNVQPVSLPWMFWLIAVIREIFVTAVLVDDGSVDQSAEALKVLSEFDSERR